MRKLKPTKKVKSKIKIADNLIYPETSADMVKYSDTTLKDAFDNYTPFEMSDFGKSLSRSSSLAEACRKMHINYFFAKDLIDNVVWNVVGAPETVNQKLHATNGNYIWRTLNLGAYDFECDFDLSLGSAGSRDSNIHELFCLLYRQNH